MLHSNSIESLLVIQDPNITFEENFHKKGRLQWKYVNMFLEN
ncbi:hypothetical protein [Paenisporosarcina sp. TG-14]|nr:hypothetical protein [Paenisporosarcina sp. TG-14]